MAGPLCGYLCDSKVRLALGVACTGFDKLTHSPLLSWVCKLSSGFCNSLHSVCEDFKTSAKCHQACEGVIQKGCSAAGDAALKKLGYTEQGHELVTNICGLI